jgi:hypothetical protein
MKCRYCSQDIVWITSVKGKHVPCEEQPYIRNGSAPLPSGRYFDHTGNCYAQHDAPCKVPLYRSHWSDCPGREQARKGGHKNVPDHA